MQTDIPAELVAAIESAMVTPRGTGGEDDEPRMMIKIVGLGAFYWEGLQPAAERISRAYPDLPAATCRKAARLIASVVGSRNRGEFRNNGRRRSGWVNSWSYED